MSVTTNKFKTDSFNFQMHIVNWNSDKFGSIAEAATEPEGLAVLGVLFEVSKMLYKFINLAPNQYALFRCYYLHTFRVTSFSITEDKHNKHQPFIKLLQCGMAFSHHLDAFSKLFGVIAVGISPAPVTYEASCACG